MEFLGTANPIMQHYVLEAIGFELYALLLIVSNLEGVKLSDVLNWSISCPELDKKLKMASHEQMDLEHFVIQTFTNVKTHYARKHKLVLQRSRCVRIRCMGRQYEIQFKWNVYRTSKDRYTYLSASDV